MHFSRIVSFFAFFLTLGTVTLASPALAGFEVVKRTESNDNTDSIKEILSTVESVVEELLPEIQSIVGQKNATLGEIDALVQEVVKSISDAHVALLVFGTGSLGDSVNTTEIALVAEKIIADVVKFLEIVDSTLPGLLAGTTTSLDPALAGLLNELNGVMPDFLSLLKQLLDSLDGITSGTLSRLSFVLVTGLFIF
ncbi:hypothetical protein A7U60_g4656 [Sanghuangporus baumii]|uniref:Uncharacterized protein n=1 Tax=Sanghuangporus baumii TaxID=108892 RepID=A0A9Q5HYL5_SANBA|nr:hypothetical protein A7U60_g4656 [Sanghuangporus baumii]